MTGFASRTAAGFGGVPATSGTGSPWSSSPKAGGFGGATKDAAPTAPPAGFGFGARSGAQGSAAPASSAAAAPAAPPPASTPDELIAQLGLEAATQDRPANSPYDQFFKGLIMPLHTALPNADGTTLDTMIRRLYETIPAPLDQP
jgi:hypothetical protein